MKTQQNIVFNIASKGVRYERLENREYMVCPTVMIVEGVLNGNGGAIFYPGSELAKNPSIWNHRPAVVFHPEEGTSATEVDFIQNHKIGLVLNTKYDKTSKKLRSEVWVDIERATEIDSSLMDRINNGETIEVSTGVLAALTLGDGEHNGTPYYATATDYVPDHLAILPDEVGASSVEDGAGLLQMNSAGRKLAPHITKIVSAIKDKKLASLVQNALSFSNIHQAINEQLQHRYGDVNEVAFWVEDVFQTFFVFHRDGSLWKLSYVLSDLEVTLSDDEPVEVVRVTEYRTIEGVFVGNVDTKGATSITPLEPPLLEVSKMKKEETVQELLALDNTQWTEGDRKGLLKMEDTMLNRLLENGKAMKKDPIADLLDPEAVAKAAKKAAEDASKTEAVLENTEPETLESYVSKAPPEIQEILVNSVKEANQKKIDLIATITNAERNQFTPEQLAVKQLGELKQIANLVAPPKPEFNLSPDFAGMAAGSLQNSEEDGEVIGLPVYDYETAS